MDKLEPLWYEVSPYVYGMIGFFSILTTNTMAKLFGAVLLSAAATILGMRKIYRETMRIRLKNHHIGKGRGY